ncbi:MAG TPA: arabinose operon transcriptional regulator AraC [Tepidisphaeraceae bacterium]|jgi:AraC family transcriptional regulator of arabinose operon|nr:arabinose operon transcriptional regulator AraC [Tepidisphaeraceae bacterium]
MASKAVERDVTYHRTVTDLYPGHLREGAGYYAYRPDGTADWLMIYTVAGRGRFGHAGGDAIAKHGDVTLLRPGTLHDYGVEEALQQWELLWVHFHPRAAWLEWLGWPEDAPGLMTLRLGSDAVSHRVRQRFVDMNALYVGPHRHARHLAMNALEEIVLTCDGVNPLTQQVKIDARIRDAMEHVARHLADRHTVEDLAEVGGLSVSRLAHLFREQTGRTPQQFVETQRINRATQLLELSGKSIKEIAHELGFENPFYFTLRFKKHVGVSPKAYRQQRKMEATGASGS